MQINHENVILFPKWRTALEEKSLEAMKQKRYAEALESLNQLLNFQVLDHEIIIGKLICLMELGRYGEARDLCEQVLENRDGNYYQYLHMYVTILFQMSEYELLMKQIDHEFSSGEMPSMIQDQLQQLYDMSRQMQLDIDKERHSEYIKELNQAIREENHFTQWRVMENFREMKAEPFEQAIRLLADKTIHPVTKTSIFKWLQEQRYAEYVTIYKLNHSLNVKPNQVTSLATDAAIKQVMLLINEIDQDNPSLFQILKQLLSRYAYVRYPIMFPGEDAAYVAAALKHIGKSYLNLHISQQKLSDDITGQYIEEIKICEVLYLSIIEE